MNTYYQHRCEHKGVMYRCMGPVSECNCTDPTHDAGEPTRADVLRDVSLPEWDLAKCYSCGARFQPMNSRQIYCDGDCRA